MTLNSENSGAIKLFLAESRKLLAKRNLPHIVNSLQHLSQSEIWWRPNAASNSAGNLVLHLCGNVRQWIISGLGGAPDARERDTEFAERGPIPRKMLTSRLQNTVREACIVLERLPRETLSQKHSIQGYRVTGLDAVLHVIEHFSYHTGQIIYITKLKRGKDLKFTKLPAIRKQKSGS